MDPTAIATAPPTGTPHRLTGVDAARGTAVLAMIVVHVPPTGPVGTTLVQLATGRSAVLFAVLAGVSLALMSGGHTGLATPPPRAGVVVRAVLLFALGLGLVALGTGPVVVLEYYAVLVVLALPFLRVRPRFLLAWAAGWALVGPPASWLLRVAIRPDSGGGAVAFSDLTSGDAAGGAALRLLLTGAHPVATWMPFILLGLAVGRLNLPDAAVQLRLAVGGTLAVLAAHGDSRLAVDVLGGRQALGTAGPTSPAVLLLDTRRPARRSSGRGVPAQPDPPAGDDQAERDGAEHEPGSGAAHGPVTP